jgi:hypothetical protein
MMRARGRTSLLHAVAGPLPVPFLHVVCCMSSVARCTSSASLRTHGNPQRHTVTLATHTHARTGALTHAHVGLQQVSPASEALSCERRRGYSRVRPIEQRGDRCRMPSIIRRGRRGDTFHGISVDGRGVFNDEDGIVTYAGQYKDGYACGLGVATQSAGTKDYAEHGTDGQYDGRYLGRWTDGLTWYRLYERGESKDFAYVSAVGTCKYKHVDCAPDDPRLLALIAQVAPVEVRPATPAPHPPTLYHSPPSNRPMDRPARFAPAGAGGRRGCRGAPPRRTPSLVAVVHSSRTAKHDLAATRARDRFAEVVAREAPSCTLTTAEGPSRQRRCHATVQHAAVPKAGMRGGAARLRARAAHCNSFPSPLAGLRYPVRFGRPRRPWPTCHCAWRCVRCAKHDGVPWSTEQALHGYSRGTRGVL